MSRLIDYTAAHLQDAAAHAENLRSGDLMIQILATTDGVQIRACAGGVRRTWLAADMCPWDELATEKDNPLIPRMQGVLFRLQRECPELTIVQRGESSQNPGA